MSIVPKRKSLKKSEYQIHTSCMYRKVCCTYIKDSTPQSGRSPKVVALFSATNFSSYIMELLQLHEAIQNEWNYAWIHYDIARRSHLMI